MSGGARFDAADDGGEESAICTVEIGPNEEDKKLLDAVGGMLAVNKDKWSLGYRNYKAQFAAAFEVEDDAGGIDVFMHYLTLPWKLLFACIPPTDMMDGWLCFFVALAGIGAVTVIVGDLAAFFGCTIGMSDATTAITFVALGTSLPDLFASKGAAQEQENADASIGNVTGSNSVNVFLGLGLPWMFASVYWWHYGQTDEWKARNPEYIDQYPDGGFIVRSGDLGYSVSVFVACALVTIAILVIRRAVVGGELGGNAACKWLSFASMILLWLVYIGASIMKNEGLTTDDVMGSLAFPGM